jgi:hypothetical protein
MLLSVRSQATVEVAAAESPPPSWAAAHNEIPDYHHRDLPKGPRITYSVVSIICMLLLATMLGECCLTPQSYIYPSMYLTSDQDRGYTLSSTANTKSP